MEEPNNNYVITCQWSNRQTNLRYWRKWIIPANSKEEAYEVFRESTWKEIYDPLNMRNFEISIGLYFPGAYEHARIINTP